VFLAVSQHHSPNPTLGVATYEKAISLAPKQFLAWQGLVSLQEELKDWDGLGKALEGLVGAYAEEREGAKCLEGLERLWKVRAEHGSTTEVCS